MEKGIIKTKNKIKNCPIFGKQKNQKEGKTNEEKMIKQTKIKNMKKTKQKNVSQLLGSAHLRFARVEGGFATGRKKSLDPEL